MCFPITKTCFPINIGRDIIVKVHTSSFSHISSNYQIDFINLVHIRIIISNRQNEIS